MGARPAARSLASRLTLWEKRDYKWKNWRHAPGAGAAGEAFFPGCALLSFYPRTERELERVLRERAGMGCACDCCGKALEALIGGEGVGEQVGRVEASARRAGVARLVTACPNCHDTFLRRAGVATEGVYARLVETGLRAPEGLRGVVFVPCPDRRDRAWLADVRRLLGEGVEVLDTKLCCGAAFVNERPDDARRAALGVLEAACETCAAQGVAPALFVYCASCAGQLERARRAAAREGDERLASLRIVHALSAVLGVEEEPDVDASILNRARAAFR